MTEVNRNISRIFMFLFILWGVNREYNFFHIDSDLVITVLFVFLYTCLSWLETHAKVIDNHAKSIEKLLYPDD